MIMKPASIALAACLATVIASNAFATNLITNGDFQDFGWDDGFTSSYAKDNYILKGVNFQMVRELQESSYMIIQSADQAHYLWRRFYDHTFGDPNGMYFVANGSTDTSAMVWESTPVVVSQAHTPYRFEAWISKLLPGDPNPPMLTFQIGDGATAWTALGTTASLSSVDAGVWVHTYVDFEFANPGTYYVGLRNSISAGGGNDIGLDDIYFGLRTGSPSFGTDSGAASPGLFSPVPVPEPSTWALALAGVVCGSRILRRRPRV
jgi:hypothetical protein